MFENALETKGDVVLDPYDYALLTRILDIVDVIRLYNNLATVFPEAIEDNVAEPYEILVTYDGRLFRRIIKTIRKFLKD